MFKRALLLVLLLADLLLPNWLFAQQQSPDLGQAASAAQIAAWDIGIAADGGGLPSGSGNVSSGEKLYNNQCANCHGPAGIGASAEDLAGAEEPLDSAWPDKTIGSYWPYASTLFDFIRRSMPMNAPGSLSDDEVYALCAYLLYLNDIITADEVIDAQRLADIKMPNRDGFIAHYPPAKP